MIHSRYRSVRLAIGWSQSCSLMDVSFTNQKEQAWVLHLLPTSYWQLKKWMRTLPLFPSRNMSLNHQLTQHSAPGEGDMTVGQLLFEDETENALEDREMELIRRFKWINHDSIWGLLQKCEFIAHKEAVAIHVRLGKIEDESLLEQLEKCVEKSSIDFFILWAKVNF